MKSSLLGPMLGGLAIVAAVAALGAALLAASASAQNPTTFRVTITNQSNPEMNITPGAYVIHTTANAFWSAGSQADLGLERIAEIGDPAEAVSSLGAGALDAAPGNGDTVVIEFTASPGDHLSFAQMLIATNDAFVGLNSMPLFQGSQPTAGTFGLIAWDAGTEENAEIGSGFDFGQPDPARGADNVDNGTTTTDPIVASDQFDGIQATVSILPIVETLSVPAGLNLIGWTGADVSTADFLAANPDVQQLFWWDQAAGAWISDLTILPDILRPNLILSRGMAIFIITTRATDVRIDLVPALPTPEPAIASRLRLDLDGLEPLASGHYEGWAIFGDDKLSTGKFNLADDGSKLTLSGEAIDLFETGVDLAGADAIVITIEAEDDIDDVPSGIVVLAGDLAGATASLAFPTNFSTIAGGYILATPTDDDSTNDTAGVWFLIPGGTPALTLPALPDGWVYEGWGVTQGTPLTTGRFLEASGTDFAAPFSGPNSGPPFPGEDFVTNLPDAIAPPVDLADGASTIVLSVEPDLDGADPTGDAPFSIKPLVGPVAAGLADHTLADMDQNLATVPTGLATIE